MPGCGAIALIFTCYFYIYYTCLTYNIMQGWGAIVLVFTCLFYIYHTCLTCNIMQGCGAIALVFTCFFLYLLHMFNMQHYQFYLKLQKNQIFLRRNVVEKTCKYSKLAEHILLQVCWNTNRLHKRLMKRKNNKVMIIKKVVCGILNIKIL